MLNPDKATIEWAAQWIDDALKAETNERTIEFGKNMAMTFRAVALPSADLASRSAGVNARAAAIKIVNDHLAPCAECFGDAMPDVQRGIEAIISAHCGGSSEAEDDAINYMNLPEGVKIDD